MAESCDSTATTPFPGLAASSSYMKEPSPVGRPKRSVVWNYFMYDPDTNQSVCQVEVTRDHGDQGWP